MVDTLSACGSFLLYTKCNRINGFIIFNIRTRASSISRRAFLFNLSRFRIIIDYQKNRTVLLYLAHTINIKLRKIIDMRNAETKTSSNSVLFCSYFFGDGREIEKLNISISSVEDFYVWNIVYAKTVTIILHKFCSLKFLTVIFFAGYVTTRRKFL